MSCPTDRRYLDSHEWHKREGVNVVLGITRFAIDELTDITYVQLPQVGSEVKAGASLGEIESVKATSELYSGVSGRVVEVNQAVVNDPSIINSDPYDKGWFVKIAVNGSGDYDALLDAEAYQAKYPTH